MDLHLTGKTAPVIGASAGIGRGIALALAAEGNNAGGSRSFKELHVSEAAGPARRLHHRRGDPRRRRLRRHQF